MRWAALKPCFAMTIHPIFEGTCCILRTGAILQRAIDIGASEEELRMFKGFFNLHPNSDLKVYRLAREKGDGSFERLLAKALEDADQFKGRAKELLYDCFVEDLAGLRGDDKRDNETLYAILVGKIEEHRRNSNTQGQARAENVLPKTFAELFKTPDGEALAIKALQRAGLVDEDATQWKDERTTGAIRAFFEALEDTGLIHKIEITPGCKLIAKRFGVQVVKNYPKAGFTEKLRRDIKSYLTNRDNNRDGI